MRPLPQFLFDIFALSLPRGHGFGNEPPVGAWQSENAIAVAVITRNDMTGRFGVLVMRRRVDGVWGIASHVRDIVQLADARATADAGLSTEDLLSVPPGVSPRPPLYDLQGREPTEMFKLLVQPSHQRAAWLLNQLYLALPKPDPNWATDCQTANFHTRLWEAVLLACFREQGLLVSQPVEAPDFRIENRLGGEAWVEAVTANPPVRYEHVGAIPTTQPDDMRELVLGSAALRFAKTIGNKLQRRYDTYPHVAGRPFVLALADFHAPSSMVWSREALLGYLYGTVPGVRVVDGVRSATETSAEKLLGETEFPAGLFRNAAHPELSAVIFTNACTIGKLNRVMVSAGAVVPELRYVRYGKFFDRRPDSFDGVPFCLDVGSDDYRRLWPQGYEPWSAELEVFHNPFAQHPLPHALLPEATHWFERDGETVCSSFYANSILWSRTLILEANDPIPTYDTIPEYLAELSKRRSRAAGDL
jgi:hypothetical protein